MWVPQHGLDLILVLPGKFPEGLGLTYTLRTIKTHYSQPLLPACVMHVFAQ